MAAVGQDEDPNRDLGLGSRLAQQSRERFLNRDGSFNVRRSGLPFMESLNLYHWMLSLSWTSFNLLVVLAYFLTNLLFAAAYTVCGPDALQGARPGMEGFDRFLAAFFFSVQTLATIGYGTLSPHGLAANIIVTLEALVGLLGFALATGLLFSRFSRPMAEIGFSNQAIIAPFRGGTAFEFRIVNRRSNQLIDVEASVVLARNETVDGTSIRKFHPLQLERDRVMFFPLHWVIVHPITDSSPLSGVTKEALDASDAEFLILLTAVDETFSQTVHSRSSYKYHEVAWNVVFADMFEDPDGSRLSIDMRKLHEIRNV
jgi:inward rectifier potassium channel